MNIFIKKLLWLFLLGASFGVSAQQPSKSSIEKLLEEFKVPGVQVSYFKMDRELLYAVGVKEIGKPAKVNDENVFQAASLSKVVAAYAFLILYDQGVFDLDTPLSHYYSYSRLGESEYADQITARMVLEHTSGLVNWEVSPGVKEWKDTPLTIRFKPGERFLYSGEGFYYLQETIEHLTGKSLEEIVREEVFEPFEMSNSSFIWQKKFDNQYVAGHNSLLEKRELRNFLTPNAAYTLWTTAVDYTKFLKLGLINGMGLKKDTYAEMVNSDLRAIRKGKESQADDHNLLGLGVRLQMNELGKALWHTGSNSGFRCFFVVYPDRKEGLVVFTNSETGSKLMEPIIPLFLNEKQRFWLLEWIKAGQS